MEKLSEPELVKHMLEIHGDIAKALDATILILDERHKNEIIEKISKGEISIFQIKEEVEKVNPKNPGEFAWDILSNLPRHPPTRKESAPRRSRILRCCCFRGESESTTC